MRKILVSTILGVGIAGTANASIVSSGFLDEKLTEYALSTSLDLKANQSDFTELNTQITNSIDNLKSLWDADIGILADSFNPNKVNNDIEGAFGLVEGFIRYSMLSLTRGWYESRDNFYQGIRQLNDGWTDSNDGTTYLGVKDLNTKIGTLPDDITVQGMYDGWTNSNGDFLPGLSMYSVGEVNVQNSYDGQNTARLLTTGAKATTIDGVDYTGPIYPLWKLSEGIDKIGDLPSGSLLGLSPDSDQIYKIADRTDTPVYPANVAEMIQQLYGAPQAGHRGIIPVIGRNISDLSKSITTRIGTLPDGKTVTDMISETDAKIGTLPAGYDSVGAALTAIKGIAEDAKAAALAAIPDPKQEGSSGKFVLTVDIVGDNATYHWEKIDREGETTTTE